MVVSNLFCGSSECFVTIFSNICLLFLTWKTLQKRCFSYDVSFAGNVKLFIEKILMSVAWHN